MEALSVTKGGDDRVLLCRGSGHVKGLLAQAADVLQDKIVLDETAWVRVLARDRGSEVAYFRTHPDVPSVDEKSSVDFDWCFSFLFLRSRYRVRIATPLFA